MIRAALATARKNSSAASCSKPAIAPGGQLEPRDGAERPAGDVDRAGGARLVHRHDRVAVAADPGAVAERLVERLAEHDPGVLDRVVGAGLEVAADLHAEAQPPVAREQLEHVVEEPDAGGDLLLARCRRGRGATRRRRSRRSCRVSCALRLMTVRFWRIRADIDSACTAKPSASAIGTPAARERGGRVADVDLAHPAAEVAGVRPEAKRAAPAVGSVWFEPAT